MSIQKSRSVVLSTPGDTVSAADPAARLVSELFPAAAAESFSTVVWPSDFRLMLPAMLPPAAFAFAIFFESSFVPGSPGVNGFPGRAALLLNLTNAAQQRPSPDFSGPSSFQYGNPLVRHALVSQSAGRSPVQEPPGHPLHAASSRSSEQVPHGDRPRASPLLQRRSPNRPRR